MKFKKIIAGVMGAVMAASCVPMSVNRSLISSISASAETSGTCGDNVSWVLSDDGVLTISGTGDMFDYVPVVSPFDNNTDIKAVIIGDGVTSIGRQAFFHCSSLTSIEIPNSVTSIGRSAFEYCSSLTSIEIPNSVTSIGERAFSGCSSLTSIEIPNSVTSIGRSAFEDCSSLTSIEIPDSVTLIGYKAFYGTKWLENKQAENPLVIVNEILIDGVTCTGDVVIPDTVISIGKGAFDNCSSLTSIEIPDSVTSIGYSAFYGTKWLENKRAENPLVIVNGILIDGLTCTGDVVIPDTVTSIGEYAFFYCSRLTSIEIPDSVTSIGIYAFSGCDALTDVYYTGTRDDWNKIDIDGGNDKLTSSKIHFSKPSTEPITTTVVNPTDEPSSGEITNLKYGDVNIDGKISIADVVILNKYLVKSATVQEQGLANADCYKDGKPDANDSLTILKVIVGTYSESELPVIPA